MNIKSRMIDKTTKIYIAGHRGLVGSALVRALEKRGYQSLVQRSRSELDLTDPHAVDQFFSEQQPEVVFLAAAKVGGIWANAHYPADFIAQNLQIQNHVIMAAQKSGVQRLFFLGSSCIYPRDCPQPIKEEYLLTGPLEPTNRPYAVAKIAGIEMCWAFNRQYGTHYLAVMPTNLYGPGDNYDLNTSHVIPALIRKMHEAKIKGASEVIVWGTGKSKREFLYSDDLADACVFLMEQPDAIFQTLTHTVDSPPVLNVGCGEDLTIRALAECIADVVRFNGQLRFDTQYPDGTPQKVLDLQKIRSLGWSFKTPLSTGVMLAYEDYLTKGIRHV